MCGTTILSFEWFRDKRLRFSIPLYNGLTYLLVLNVFFIIGRPKEDACSKKLLWKPMVNDTTLTAIAF